jgi:arylsulfatase A-like enzyme
MLVDLQARACRIGRPPLATVLAVAITLVGVVPGCEHGSGSPARPNVVLISIDTLRADHLGAYGYARATSPSIDALAADGVLFESAVSPSSWTLPAHASMLSGVSPYRHGAVTSATRIRDDVPLAAEMLRAHGYRTVGLVNAPFVSRDYGFARGFERFEQRFEHKRRDVAARHAAVLAAVRALEPPFFLFLHYMDVHSPYRPPKGFNRFARDRRSTAVFKSLGQRGFLGVQREIRTGRLRVSEDEVQRLVDLYDGEVLAMDAKVGEIVAAVRSRYPDTVFIVTADHGEEFLEHGSIGHSETLYEEVLRVPLIVAGPGIARGVRVAAQVSLLDVVPTVLELVGAPARAGLDGASLAAALRGEALARDGDALVALQTSSHDGKAALRGVRSPARKILHDDRSGRGELYDLARDPGERTNLWPAPEDDRLARALAALVPPETSPAPRPDADTVEALKALGYL